MKIKTVKKSYDEVMALPPRKREKPKTPTFFWRSVTKILSAPALIRTHFKSKKTGMEKLGKNEPALFLMNHSSFIDVEIMASMLYPRKINIVTTSDAFIGLDWLLRQVGCMPTNRFTADTRLVRDILYAVRKKKNSLVLFPEAGYTLDGTHTEMGNIMGKLIKFLNIPVVMIKTEGAFHHDPIYNGLQVRKNRVSATMTYLLSKEDILGMTPEEICALALDGMEYDILDTYEPAYRCTCSRDKVARAFAAMSREERLSLPNEEGVAEATCRFCDAVYTFTREDLERIGK